MRTTEFWVDYDLFDTTALQDAQESSQSNSYFGNLALMKEEVKAPNYGTLEHNYFVLDGSMEEFPEDPDNIAYFSSVQSDESGALKCAQVDIHFSENHTSIGLTLYFLDEYPMELDVIWYDLSGGMLSKKRFYPDGVRYFCRNQVEDYGNISIIFRKALPCHNVKLQRIEYGTTLTWNSDNIKSGKLINDTDPISDKIATDKLTFEFVDTTDEFNLGNPGGLHKLFQRRQHMSPYEVVNGQVIQLGTFFLDSDSTSNNICKLSAIDYKGMLANTDFREGRIYNGDPAGEVITEIMESAGIKDYTVDEETASEPLFGTLKIQTCQKALREILFACGSIINTARKSGVEIRKNNRKIVSTIGRSRKFSTTITADKYVSDITVKYKNWVLDDKIIEIAKGVYGVGTHTIQLSNPAANMTANAGKIIKQMPYYVVLQIDAETRTDVIIYGQKYIGEELAATSSIEHIKAGELRNTKSFSGTLLNFESAKRAADNILDHYQLQKIIQTKHLSDTESAGEWVEIENAVKTYENFTAAIESMATDLTGGFISTAKYRGYYNLTSDYYYADSEIYADEEVGII